MADRGVTAKWLAARVQILESTLANFRNGFRRIPPDVVEGMARELDTTVDFLLERTENARPEAILVDETPAYRRYDSNFGGRS